MGVPRPNRSTGLVGRSAGRVRVFGAATAAAGLALLLASFTAPWFATSAGAAPSPTGNISVVQRPGLAAGSCIGPSELIANVYSDASIFRLTVIAASTPCAPIRATAAIYAMPGGGAAWPQQLKESLPVVIDAAGSTEITFVKTCTPVQFDVVTGPTPATISPFGEMHGPLLFPTDLSTAFQDVGAVCQPVTTTTGATTTTAVGATSTAPTTTGTPNTTSTTVAVLGTSVTPTTGPTVLGTSADRSTAAALAVTGVSSLSTAWAGAIMVIGGTAAVAGSRRRLDPRVRMVTSSVSVNDDSPFGVD